MGMKLLKKTDLPKPPHWFVKSEERLKERVKFLEIENEALNKELASMREYTDKVNKSQLRKKHYTVCGTHLFCPACRNQMHLEEWGVYPSEGHPNHIYWEVLYAYRCKCGARVMINGYYEPTPEAREEHYQKRNTDIRRAMAKVIKK